MSWVMRGTTHGALGVLAASRGICAALGMTDVGSRRVLSLSMVRDDGGLEEG